MSRKYRTLSPAEKARLRVRACQVSAQKRALLDPAAQQLVQITRMMQQASTIISPLVHVSNAQIVDAIAASPSTLQDQMKELAKTMKHRASLEHQEQEI